MGGFTSKLIDEIVSDSKESHTPKTRRVPFDPRSPSDHITRTPITMLNTSDSGVDTTPTDSKVIKVIDPRSPNNEVNRTPIIIEKKEGFQRPRSLKPNKEMNFDSFLCSSSDESQDPRSPTTKVPRTPLEDKVLEFGESCSNHEECSEESTKTETVTQERKDKQENNTLVKKLFVSDSSNDKVPVVRRPLALVQHTNAGKTPRDLLQAKHCKIVEDEYNKNICSLLPDQENTVTANTDFVEDI